MNYYEKFDIDRSLSTPEILKILDGEMVKVLKRQNAIRGNAEKELENDVLMKTIEDARSCFSNDLSRKKYDDSLFVNQSNDDFNIDNILNNYKNLEKNASHETPQPENDNEMQKNFVTETYSHLALIINDSQAALNFIDKRVDQFTTQFSGVESYNYWELMLIKKLVIIYVDNKETHLSNILLKSDFSNQRYIDTKEYIPFRPLYSYYIDKLNLVSQYVSANKESNKSEIARKIFNRTGEVDELKRNENLCFENFSLDKLYEYFIFDESTFLESIISCINSAMSEGVCTFDDFEDYKSYLYRRYVVAFYSEAAKYHLQKSQQLLVDLYNHPTIVNVSEGKSKRSTKSVIESKYPSWIGWIALVFYFFGIYYLARGYVLVNGEFYHAASAWSELYFALIPSFIDSIIDPIVLSIFQLIHSIFGEFSQTFIFFTLEYILIQFLGFKFVLQKFTNKTSQRIVFLIVCSLPLIFHTGLYVYFWSFVRSLDDAWECLVYTFKLLPIIVMDFLIIRYFALKGSKNVVK